MGSKSSSSSSTSTEQRDERVAATDQAVAIGADADVNVELTSPEGLEAFIEVVGEAGAAAFEFAQSAQEEASAQTVTALELVKEAAESEARGLAADALKLAVPVAIGAVAITALRKR